MGALMDESGDVICCTLELPWKGNKRNVSCIPEGEYPLRPDPVGGRYEDTWEVTGVPDRSAILLHPGNELVHTQGCLLTGEYITWDGRKLRAARSRKAMDAMREKTQRALYPSNPDHWLEIVSDELRDVDA